MVKLFSQLILAFLLFLSSGNLFAQDYDLNNYKYRFQKYRQAQFNFDFNGDNNYNINKRSTKGTALGSQTVKSSSDENAFAINTNLPFYYYKTSNTERLQQNQSLSLLLDYRRGNNNFDKSLQFNQYFNYSNNNRFYTGLNFTEFNFTSSVNHGNNNSVANSSHPYLKYFNEDMSGNYSMNIGKGKGRQEYVTDAVTTMFLLRDLKRKAGVGNYTNEQVENIAKGITRIRNTRLIDYRFRLIDQLTLLDSTLKRNGIVPTSDIRYFTTINDNWLHATQFQRYSGSRWSVNYIHKGHSDLRKHKQKLYDTAQYNVSEYMINNMFNGVELNYNWSKQASLFIQRNFDINVGGGLNFSTSKSNLSNYNFIQKNKNDAMQYYLNLSYGYLFQPNTRTYIRFNVDLNSKLSTSMYGLRVGNPDENKNMTLTQYIIPRVEIFKFFTPRFYYRLSIISVTTLRMDKNSNINLAYRNDNNFNFPLSVNMGFTYTFF